MTDAGEHVRVLVVGAGPAGLGAAHAIAAAGAGDVLVIDREQVAGGVPRHCHHTGFGVRDLHRSMTGPRYAEHLIARAAAAGVRIETATMATGWAAPGVLSLTSPSGVRTVSADSVILATGARERPRAARLVPGDRGDGVFTTGQLQQWTYEHHLPVGHRAVVVGAEHVSYSAVLTLRHAGVRTVAMITDLAHQQSYPMFAALTRRGLRVPLLTEVEVAAIRGHGRVQAIDLRNVVTGATSSIDADTIVFTGDWIPDHELARAAGASIDAGSKGPVVDLDGATSVDDVYAAGNLVHPAETADIVALRARQVGAAVAHHLGGRTPARPAVDIVVAAPLQWAAPGRIVPLAGIPARGDALGLVLRTSEARRSPTVVIAQGGRQLARFRVRAAIPNRSLRVPIGWSALVRPDAGAVTVSLE